MCSVQQGLIRLQFGLLPCKLIDKINIRCPVTRAHLIILTASLIYLSGQIGLCVFFTCFAGRLKIIFIKNESHHVKEGNVLFKMNLSSTKSEIFTQTWSDLPHDVGSNVVYKIPYRRARAWPSACASKGILHTRLNASLRSYGLKTALVMWYHVTWPYREEGQISR